MLSELQNVLKLRYNIVGKTDLLNTIEGTDIDSKINELLTKPLKIWAEPRQVARQLSQNIQTDTLMQVQTGQNISQPGQVSILKANSTAKVYLTDGHETVRALLLKCQAMDLKQNINGKILVKANGRNTVKHGVLLLRDYQILDGRQKMDIEELPEEANEFLNDLEDLEII